MAGASAAAARSLIAVIALAAAAWAQAVTTPSSSPAISDAELSDPIAREWKVRDFAADPVRIAAALEFDDRERPQRAQWIYDVLSRAQRAAPSDERKKLVIQTCLFLADQRADVALARLEALISTGVGVRFTNCFPALDAREAAPVGDEHGHALPLLRAARARWLRFESDDECAQRELREMLRDADERVALAAWTSLALRVAEERSAPEALTAGWTILVASAEPRTCVDALVLLEAVRAPASALAALAASAKEGELLWRGALEALRSSAGAAPEAEHLLAAWLLIDRETLELRELFLRGAKAELSRGNGFGRAAFEHLARATAPDERAQLLALALEALDPREFAALALRTNDFDELRRAEFFERLRGRSIDWKLEQLTPWLDPAARSPQVRSAVVEWLGAASVAAEHAAVESALAVALLDPELDIARTAFLGLCDVADPTQWGSALRSAWLRFEENERPELAARLPRTRPFPEFRADWIALGSRGGESLDAVLDLISAFAPDVELARHVELWIDEGLKTWSEGGPDRALERRLAALARALSRLAHESSSARLDQLARWASGVSDEVGKVALFALGQTAAGRAGLPHWLSEDAPSRLRVEAALMLAPHGDSRAAHFLRSDFAHVDLQLKGRSLAALAAHGDEPSLAFLATEALDARCEQQLRLRALEFLARRSPPSLALLASATREGDPEIALGAWRLYVSSGAPAAREALRARLSQLALALRSAPEADHAWRVAERADLLRLAAEVELVDDELAREWRRPLDLQAERDLTERFSDPTEPRPDFTYGAELDFGRVLARVRKLRTALDDDPRWRRWDASVLEALGAAACDEGDLATGRALLAAAHIALLGEPDGELRRNREFRFRQRALAAAEQAGDWDACARLAAAHLDDVRTRRVGARTAERWLGGLDPLARVDGVARLECALELARARLALASGDLSAARAHRDRATPSAERSGLGADALRRFDDELQARSAAVK